ncbi:MAG: FecR domain-containing protein [Tannerella sp.]|jgi:ferric-dicitrate binding protein FerR (iron transport regulator)|nr:FecR domain-containing protein [Tannerella sp.]
MEQEIRKYLLGELDATEKAAFMKRLASDDELKAQFVENRNMQALTALSGQVVYDPKESEAAYRRFMQRVMQRKIRRTLTRTVACAAAIAVLVFVTYRWTAVQMKRRMEAEIITNTLSVPAGQRVNVTLQDGTHVWLNAQTRLTYPSRFADRERRVTIEGEAFFEVRKDAGRPFIVTSQGMEMEVLGTSFNVNSDPEKKTVQASLIEGSLKVYFPGAESKSITLKPNEQVSVREKRMQVEKIRHPDYFLWKEGIYSFQNELLIDVLKKLERYYDVTIEAKDLSIYQWEYTGKFRHRDSIDEIIRLIRKIHKFKVEKDEENNVITLTKK